jgi:GTP-binding protein Era
MKEFAEENVEIVPVSARKGKNIKELIKVLTEKLPEGDKLFEQEIVSDRSEKFMVSEIMREKILLKFDKEIPHGVAVIINEFKTRENGKVVDVNLDVICEKPNHKAILIGKGGKAIKEVSSFAREEMEKFLGKKVFLTTYVKVKEDWRNSAYLLKQHGYGEN